MVQPRLSPTVLGLLGILAASCVTPSPVEARPTGRLTSQAQTRLVQLQTASSACFAEAVLANPAALAHAKAGRWYQAAGVIGFICRQEVDRMMQARDAVEGAGAGQRFFRTTYAKHLDRDLAARLRPGLERQSVASAELLNEPTTRAPLK